MDYLWRFTPRIGKTMKHLFQILELAKGLRSALTTSVIFQYLSVVFGVFSFTLLVPLLKVLFMAPSELQELLAKPIPVFEWKQSVIFEYMNVHLAQTIDQAGPKAALIGICSLLIGSMFLKNIFHYGGVYFGARVVNGAVLATRNRLFKKITDLHIGYFSEERKGDLISRMTSDMKEIEWGVQSTIPAVFRSPFEIVVQVAVLFFFNVELTLFLLLFLPAAGGIISIIGKSLRESADDGQKKVSELVTTTEEALTGLKVIKAFGAISFIRNRFVRQNTEHYRIMMKVYSKVQLASPVSEFLGVTATAVVLWFGAGLVFDGKLDGEVLITYLVMFAQLITPFKALSTGIFNAQRACASLSRINKVIDAEQEIVDKPNAICATSFKDKIEFKDVWFRYENDFVLQDINLKILAGKTVALVGQSGSGKSTMADLLPRFYDVTKGAITIDGVDVKDYEVASLNSIMGIVTQHSILFNDTVYNNIAFGLDNVKKEDVIEAAKVANAHDFIMGFENGYDSNIGDGGSKLSGGQRQRISIARAVLKNPPIMILDEATSALDTESEKLVQDALSKLMSNRTSLVIAHRLSTIQHADEILVLNDGVIVERGTHNQLLQSDSAYKRLIEMQSF